MFRVKQCAITASFLLLGFTLQVPVLLGQRNCDCSAYTSVTSDISERLYANVSGDDYLSTLSQQLVYSNEIGCQIKGYELVAAMFLTQKQIDSCEYYLKKATMLSSKNSCSNNQLYDNNMLYLRVFFQKQNFDEAIQHGYKALEIAESVKQMDKQAETLTYLSRIFARMQQYGKSLEYSRLALSFIQQLPPSVRKAMWLEVLTQNYNSYRQVRGSDVYVEAIKKYTPKEAVRMVVEDFKNNGTLDTIRLLTQEFKSLAARFNHRTTLLKAYRHLHTVEMALDNNDMALRYIDSSLMLCIRGVDDQGLFVGFGDKADIYWKLGNGSLAARFADSCLFYAQKTGIPTSIANAYLTKSEIAHFNKDWEQAFYAMKEVKVIMDSVQNLDRTKVVNELEKKYNQAKNEKTIKELAQEKRIYLLLVLAALLSIVIFFFYMRQQALKHRQIILETEQRLNRARMNPHFFFNALTSLQSFALRENDGKKLATNLSKFSHIMRETLESTYKEYVTIEDEMAFLDEYLEIQKIRFPKKFNYTLQAASDVEIDELLIPSMIIQPFVENSIEHGFSDMGSEEGQVQVIFKKEKNEILIEISDNGTGLKGAQKISEEHISRATQIIKDRVYLLNIKLKTNARFYIDNHPQGKGVLVRIYLPIIFDNENTHH